MRANAAMLIGFLLGNIRSEDRRDITREHVCQGERRCDRPGADRRLEMFVTDNPPLLRGGICVLMITRTFFIKLPHAFDSCPNPSFVELIRLLRDPAPVVRERSSEAMSLLFDY